MTALASSLRERPVPPDTLVLGEVGLTGEVRRVTDLQSRLREAGRHGFRRVVMAESEPGAPAQRPRREKGMTLLTTGSVQEGVALALQPAGADHSSGEG